jgi:pilus assembly protein TadC
VERSVEEIQAELVARGIDAPLARRLAQAIAKRSAVLDGGRYQAVVAGVALAVAAQRSELSQLRKAADELGEMQRLLTSFTDELKKLDEALETLAAYVARMKNPQPTPPSGRVLH